jgi:hypothetical protein
MEEFERVATLRYLYSDTGIMIAADVIVFPGLTPSMLAKPVIDL